MHTQKLNINDDNEHQMIFLSFLQQEFIFLKILKVNIKSFLTKGLRFGSGPGCPDRLERLKSRYATLKGKNNKTTKNYNSLNFL
jgi:hypothetical protein